MAAPGPKLVFSGHDSSASSPFAAPAKVEYSAQVIDQIRAETVGALMSIPHGGLEIAGVLFGTRSGDTAYIAAHRPIECEHAAGPSFSLSEKDAGQLERLLLDSSSDPELAGYEVLGWYVSHTRRPFSIVHGDVQISDRFFRAPFSLTGVVQPAASGKARFAWFPRDKDGLLDAQSPSSEFTIYPAPTQPGAASISGGGPAQAGSAPSETIEKGLDLAAAPGARRDTQPIAIRSAKPVERPPGRRPLLAWALMIAILAAGGVFAVLWLLPTSVHPPPLHVLDTGTQLRIDWDPKLPVVQLARSAVLEFREASADPIRISLSQEMLRSGSVSYDKPASKVEVHLRLTDPKGLVSESMVYFIGREPEPKRPMQEVAKTVEPAPAPAPTPAIVVPSPLPDNGSAERLRTPSASARPFQPPAMSRAAALAAEPLLVDPPKISIQHSQPGVPPNLSSLRTDAPVAAPPPVAPPAMTPASIAPASKIPAQPTSGRLIWTGELHRGSVLQISDRGPSSGSLNGKLPSRPMKVSMHSAELLDGVIAVYTPDANSLRTAEAPGRRNGWNVTMYKFDPKHAHDLTLVEAPAEDNNFKLRIKSNNRPVSIIVIDWHATN